MHPTLPYRPDREALLGFTLAMALVAGAAVTLLALLSGLLGAGASFGLAALAAGTIALAGHRWERLADYAYRVWNRVAKGYAEFARRAVTAIWYWTVLTAVSKSGARKLELGGSPWLARGTQAASTYVGQGGDELSGDARPGLGEYSRWARSTGRTWALVLLPLLFVLRALESRDPKAPPSDMYTLY
jgi:hypothetical protein